MILADSSVWIDYFRGSVTARTEKLDALLGQELLAVGDLILAEVLQGFRGDWAARKLRSRRRSIIVRCGSWA